MEHPSWNVWPAVDATVHIDVADLYGPEVAEPLSTLPTSAFIADGSAIGVYQGQRIQP